VFLHTCKQSSYIVFILKAERLLLYRLHRFYRLRDSRYLVMDDRIEENLSASEQELLTNYEQLVASYSDKVQIDISSVSCCFLCNAMK